LLQVVPRAIDLHGQRRQDDQDDQHEQPGAGGFQITKGQQGAFIQRFSKQNSKGF
jgi:hypothetical protein